MKGGKGGRPRKSANSSPTRHDGSGDRGKPPKRGSGGKPLATGAPKKGSRKKPDVGGSARSGEE